MPRATTAFARDMMRQCRFIKPLLMHTPPDPTSFKPRDLMELLYLGQRFHRLGETAHVRNAALLDHELLQICWTNILKATSSKPILPAARSLVLRWAPRFARHGLRAAAPLHGRQSTTLWAPGALPVAAWGRLLRRWHHRSYAPAAATIQTDAGRGAYRDRGAAGRCGVALADGTEIKRRHPGLRAWM